jgi:hypothetical protein
VAPALALERVYSPGTSKHRNPIEAILLAEVLTKKKSMPLRISHHSTARVRQQVIQVNYISLDGNTRVVNNLTGTKLSILSDARLYGAGYCPLGIEFIEGS